MDHQHHRAAPDERGRPQRSLHGDHTAAPHTRCPPPRCLGRTRTPDLGDGHQRGRGPGTAANATWAPCASSIPPIPAGPPSPPALPGSWHCSDAIPSCPPTCPSWWTRGWPPEPCKPWPRFKAAKLTWTQKKSQGACRTKSGSALRPDSHWAGLPTTEQPTRHPCSSQPSANSAGGDLARTSSTPSSRTLTAPLNGWRSTETATATASSNTNAPTSTDW
jgi:hypothetical protein